MFGIGETELVIILAFGFMIFGPDKLPGMGRTIGRALRQFRQAQEGFTQVVQTEVMDPLQDAMGDSLDSGTRQQRRATAEERAAALAQDADIEGDEAPTQRTETFAERKARLAAERKAREERETAESETNTTDAAPTTSHVPEVEQEPETPDTSAAALYALGGRSSFGAAKEEAKVTAEAEESAAHTVAEEAIPAESSDEPSTSASEGKEAGTEA